MLLGNVRDHPHLALVQHHAGGVAGVGDHNGPGIGGDEAFDALPVGVAVALPGVGGQGTDNTACRVDEGGVVGIVRLGDDDLGIGVQNGQAGKQQCFTAAGSHQNVVVFQLHTQLGVIILNGFNEHRASGRSLVFQSPVREVVDRVIEFHRRGQVRLADVQMVDFLSVLFRLHGKGMELPHGRGLTTVCVNGNLHTYLHRRPPKTPDFYILS